ncbi:hypothetical protein Prudu_021157, partial [Prunus dulcis]
MRLLKSDILSHNTFGFFICLAMIPASRCLNQSSVFIRSTLLCIRILQETQNKLDYKGMWGSLLPELSFPVVAAPIGTSGSGSSDDANEPGIGSSDNEDEPISKRFKEVGGERFSGKTVGIIGSGRIGKARVEKGWSREERITERKERQQKLCFLALQTKISRIVIIGLERIGKASLEVLQILFNCWPQTVAFWWLRESLINAKETNDIVNFEVMDALGPKGVLINIGRGPPVDKREYVHCWMAIMEARYSPEMAIFSPFQFPVVSSTNRTNSELDHNCFKCYFGFTFIPKQNAHINLTVLILTRTNFLLIEGYGDEI